MRKGFQTQEERDETALDRLRKQREAERLRAVDRAEAAAMPRPVRDMKTDRTERIDADPDLALLYAKGEHNKTRIAEARAEAINMIDTAKREAADLVLAAAGERPPEIRFAAMEKKFNRWRTLIIAIVVPVISFGVIVVKYLQARGAADERALIEREQVRDALKEIGAALIDIRSTVRALENGALESRTRIDSIERHQPTRTQTP